MTLDITRFTERLDAVPPATLRVFAAGCVRDMLDVLGVSSEEALVAEQARLRCVAGTDAYANSEGPQLAAALERLIGDTETSKPIDAQRFETYLRCLWVHAEPTTERAIDLVDCAREVVDRVVWERVDPSVSESRIQSGAETMAVAEQVEHDSVVLEFERRLEIGLASLDC